MPTQRALFHYRGTEFVWKNAVLNITTDQIAEAWFTVKTPSAARTDTTDTGAVTQVKMTTGAITVVDATTLLVSIPAATTDLWVRDTYAYDLKIRTQANKDYVLTYGVLTVRFDVTKTL